MFLLKEEHADERYTHRYDCSRNRSNKVEVRKVAAKSNWPGADSGNAMVGGRGTGAAVRDMACGASVETGLQQAEAACCGRQGRAGTESEHDVCGGDSTSGGNFELRCGDGEWPWSSNANRVGGSRRRSDGVKPDILGWRRLSAVRAQTRIWVAVGPAIFRAGSAGRRGVASRRWKP